MIEVVRPAPYTSIQDLGRDGFRAEGVPLAGAMDREALAVTNFLVGNDAREAAIEWALGPLTLRFEQEAVIAVAAPGSEIALDAEPVGPWTAVPVRAGAELMLDVPQDTRFGYLGVAGGLEVPEVFGSRSTYLRGGFGGLDGRLLKKGDRLAVRAGAGRPAHVGEPLPEALTPGTSDVVRMMEGPHARFFGDEVWRDLEEGAYLVSAVADRMGYRLNGPTVSHTGPASLLSEAVCPGAIQVPDGGTPLVLMVDGPTVGGYPKIGVVISADLRLLAQMDPGERPSFTRVDGAQALAAAKAVQERLDAARVWANGVA